ncbi:MAG: hypothetical protein C0483_14005 [Pirellula sp.]|nr:hypothetical protein [Pirellula sp.]
MLTVPKLIAALERRGVVPPADVARLQQLYAAAPSEFGIRVMLKWLVNRGRISAEQSEKIQQARPGVTAEKLLDELFPASGDMELTIAEDEDDREEDTKDLLPDEELNQEQLTLPPRGSPTFAGGVPPRPPSPPADPLIAPDGSAKTNAPAGVGGYSDLVSELFAGDGVDLAAPISLPQARRKLRRGNRWDSPLMMVGGGLLLLLVLGGAFLLWRIGRQSGDDAFATAESAYGEGAYARAVELYDKFLLDYPNHPASGRAVVHRGLSRIRLTVETTNDWSRARQTAADVLGEIAPHEDFGSVRPDLGVLLPDIAQHLARQALAKNDAALLAEAREAQGLVEKYLPPSDVLRARNAETETLIAQTQRRLDRDLRTMETIAAMKAAVAKRDIAAAFQAHAAFVAGDGAAAEAPALRTALLDVARSAAQGARFVAAATQAETGEPAGPALRFAPLLVTKGSAVEALRGTAVTTIVGGTAFAFDGADGKLMWRRTVGFDSILSPQRIGTATTADILLHDSIRREFLVVDTTTGAVRRRFAVPQNGSDANQRSWAAVYDQRLYLTLASGRLYVFDLTTGASTGYVEFPQPLQQAAALDPRGRVLYQAADDGVVYTLAASDLRVLESGVLGETGDATTAPFCVGAYLLLFERRGDAGRMLVYETDREGLKPKAIGRHDFATYVPLLPATSQRYVTTVDLAGTLKVFDFSAREAQLIVKPVAEYRLAGGKQLRHVVFQGTQLWIAGNQLERLELQTTLGKLSQVRAYMPRSHALQSPLVTAEHVVYLYRDGERQSVNVAAIVKADGVEAWNTWFGIPVAAAPLVNGDDQRILFTADGVDSAQFTVVPTAANATGAVAEKLSVHIERGVLRLLGPPLPTDVDTIALPVVNKIASPEGSAVASGTAGEKYRLLVFREGAAPSFLSLSPDDQPPAAEISAFQHGALVPTSLGNLRWLAIAEKAQDIAPFQPPLIAGTETEWTRAEVVGDSIVISDRRTHLYHLQLQKMPTPHLAAAGQVSLSRPLVGNLAVVGTMAYAVDSAHTLQTFKLPDLTAGPTWDLPDACVWNGPTASGKLVFVATSEPQGLACRALDERGQLVWEQRLPVGTLPPVATSDAVFLADIRGGVARLNAADGRETKRIETGLAITHGPFVHGDKLLLATSSGELVEMAQP